jgi:hypothetical protein
MLFIDNYIRFLARYLTFISKLIWHNSLDTTSDGYAGTVFLRDSVVTTVPSAAAALKVHNSGKEARSRWR